MVFAARYTPIRTLSRLKGRAQGSPSDFIRYSLWHGYLSADLTWLDAPSRLQAFGFPLFDLDDPRLTIP